MRSLLNTTYPPSKVASSQMPPKVSPHPLLPHRGQGPHNLHYTNNSGKYVPTLRGCQKPQPFPLAPCTSPFTHPLVPSVVSIILLSITFSLRPDKAMLFWYGKSLSVILNNFYCIIQGVSYVLTLIYLQMPLNYFIVCWFF